MNKAFGAVAFVLGAAAGAVTTWFVVRKRYEQIAQEEIDSVKEVFSKRYAEEKADDISDKSEMTEEELDRIEEENDETPEEETVKVDYHKMVGKYTEEKPDISEIVKEKEDKLEHHNVFEEEEEYEKPIVHDKPYIIPPDEYGLDHEYDQIGLTLYSDHVLADDMDEVVENVEELIGYDALNHFGEYEEDSVYVRNDKLKAEYEILLDLRKYSDILEDKPYIRKGVL